jgi:hypothetical protein
MMRSDNNTCSLDHLYVIEAPSFDRRSVPSLATSDSVGRQLASTEASEHEVLEGAWTEHLGQGAAAVAAVRPCRRHGKG